jgi:hypothetical protein
MTDQSELLDDYQQDTRRVCWVAEISRRRLQALVKDGVLVPARRGRCARPGEAQEASYFTFQQMVGAAYGERMKAAGAHASWADLAVAWVANQHLGKLFLWLTEGKTVLCLQPGGRGLLAEAPAGPDVSRADRVAAATLNLGTCLNRVFQRLAELLPEGDREKLEESYAEVLREAMRAGEREASS